VVLLIPFRQFFDGYNITKTSVFMHILSNLIFTNNPTTRGFIAPLISGKSVISNSCAHTKEACSDTILCALDAVTF